MKASSLLRPYFLLPIVLLAGACAETTAFEPTENVTATGHAGQPAAGYDIGKAASGAPYVHVNVWSDGASNRHGRTELTFAAELRDTGAMAVQLDDSALRLEAFDTRGRQLPPARLVRIQPQGPATTVPAGSADTVRLVFALPVQIDPDRISSLRLRWGIVRQDGLRYVQFTEFRQVPEYYGSSYVSYSPVWGFYDPFFSDPFFWGPPYLYRVPVERVPVERVIVRREHHSHHHHRG